MHMQMHMLAASAAASFKQPVGNFYAKYLVVISSNVAMPQTKLNWGHWKTLADI